jgi:hypothetical protein
LNLLIDKLVTRYKINLNTSLLTMIKPKGGRGQKAPYETAQVRVPVPIKPDVERLIENYRASVLGDSDKISPDNSDEFLVALKLVDRFIEERNLSTKMNTRDNTNLKRFKEWLENKNKT